MYETEHELDALQDLMDRSYASAGAHLLEVHTPEHRLTARQLVAVLTGMQVLTLATVTAGGQPRVGPVDGHFVHGAFWFGSSHDSARFRHLRARPAVSAAHVRDEEFAVVAHGHAVEVDLADPACAWFADHCLAIYGESWDRWGRTAAYARVDADALFAFAMDPASMVSDEQSMTERVERVTGIEPA